MNNEYKPLTNAEKQQSIRMGILPALGDRDTILSVIKNVLETGFDWRQDGNILTVTHPKGIITIQNGLCDFQWND